MNAKHGKLTCIRGGRSAFEPVRRIALSIVHPLERIDIPVSAVVSIEAVGEFVFTVNGTDALRRFPSPRVVLTFTPPIQRRIRRLSQRTAGQLWEIFVRGECICSPRLLEPLSGESLNLSAIDLAEAEALAHRLRTGWRAGRPHLVSVAIEGDRGGEKEIQQ